MDIYKYFDRYGCYTHGYMTGVEEVLETRLFYLSWIFIPSHALLQLRQISVPKQTN